MMKRKTRLEKALDKEWAKEQNRSPLFVEITKDWSSVCALGILVFGSIVLTAIIIVGIITIIGWF